jgi:ribosomal protein S28E/S33
MSNHNTPFSQQLAFLSKGCLDEELTELLSEVVKAVRETGKTGSLTLTLKVQMLNNRDENAVKITPAVKSKLPELAPYETIMFSTGDGDLLRDDPNQRKLPLEEVPARTRTAFNQ